MSIWQKLVTNNFYIYNTYIHTHTYIRTFMIHKYLDLISYICNSYCFMITVIFVLDCVIRFHENKLFEIVISILRNGLLKACARFIIERSKIRKKQHAFKSVHFGCRMVLFYTIWEKSSFPYSVEKKYIYIMWFICNRTE